LLDLDGKLLEGEINPTNAEIVHMHAIVYKQRPETGAVVHTHSTYATSFALASRALGCSYDDVKMNLSLARKRLKEELKGYL
jgi:L-fuculose-phosphate aldolase